MPPHTPGGIWPYRGFTIRFRHHADRDALSHPAAPWSAVILEAPQIPPLSAATFVRVREAAEQATDTLIAQGHPIPAHPSTSLYRRYHRITAYLATLPETQREVVLSFAALEELLGGPLPNTARTNPQYWTTPSAVRVQGWRRVGWRARLRVDEQCVVFSRAEDTP